MREFRSFEDLHAWLEAVCWARREFRGDPEAEEFLTVWAKDIYGGS